MVKSNQINNSVRSWAGTNMRIKAKGFTFIEILVVVGVLGILMLAAYPSVQTTLDKRSLEGTARDILTTLQGAKFQAVNKRIQHRVRFINTGTAWSFQVEQEVTAGTWSMLPNYVPKNIPTKFTVTVNLPNNTTVVFSPAGYVSNYDNTQHLISLVYPKLVAAGAQGQRTLTIYFGGSIEYTKL
jgi:prepilin-type N-terminal cleavage/methylation domain-containing protein